jgi:phenylpyruvate tautomerase PptA (4-oxalocrotonate tautomerase family)
MPLTRIALRRGKSATYQTALTNGIYQAMRETFDMPEDDLFMIIDEHDEATFAYGATYMGIARTDDLIMIQITCNNTRTVQKKAALYKRIAERLSQNPGYRRVPCILNATCLPGKSPGSSPTSSLVAADGALFAAVPDRPGGRRGHDE